MAATIQAAPANLSPPLKIMVTRASKPLSYKRRCPFLMNRIFLKGVCAGRLPAEHMTPGCTMRGGSAMSSVLPGSHVPHVDVTVTYITCPCIVANHVLPLSWKQYSPMASFSRIMLPCNEVKRV